VSVPAERTVSDRRVLERLYAPIQSDLRRVETILEEQLCHRQPELDELLRYGCLLGGKRLRPALLLLAGRAFGPLNDQHHTLAAVVEMIHTATLVHDDVLDGATTRRHLMTVNARWDNHTSVLLGDYLFSHAFFLAATTGSAEACCRIGKATNVVCAGELQQMLVRYNFSVQEADYLEIVAAKTGQLCACSCELGAWCAGATERHVRRLFDYGMYLGIAFQIVDDLLDIVGHEPLVGKSLGIDCVQGIPTLPWIRLFEQLSPAERQRVQQQLCSVSAQGGGARRNARRGHEESESDRDTPRENVLDADLRALLEGSDALEHCRRRAEEFAARAVDALDGLPQSEALRSLAELPDFVVKRGF
jgi:octaprenyl-diphosphate synthase